MLLNSLVLVTPVAIPETLSEEVRGHTMVYFGGWSTSLYNIGGRFNGWHRPHKFIISALGSLWISVISLIGEGGGFQVLMYLHPPKLQDTRVLRILVEIFVFPTDPPPGAHGGANTLVTGGGAAHNCDFRVLRIPFL